MGNSLTSSGLTLGGGIATGIQYFVNNKIGAGYSIGINNVNSTSVVNEEVQIDASLLNEVGKLINVYYFLKAVNEGWLSSEKAIVKLPSSGRYLVYYQNTYGSNTAATPIKQYRYLTSGPVISPYSQSGDSDTSYYYSAQSHILSGGATLDSVTIGGNDGSSTGDYHTAHCRATILRLE